MILKATIGSYYRHLWEMVIYLLACISLPFVFAVKNNGEDYECLVWLSIISFILLCTPSIILFFRFMLVNKNIELKYMGNNIHVINNGMTSKININEVSHVDVKLTFPTYFNGFRFLATDSYLYAVINLKTGERITVTSLIDNELFDTKQFFKDKVKTNRMLRFLCWPPKTTINKQ